MFWKPDAPFRLHVSEAQIAFDPAGQPGKRKSLFDLCPHCVAMAKAIDAEPLTADAFKAVYSSELVA